jgi:hypothetical protein
METVKKNGRSCLFFLKKAKTYTQKWHDADERHELLAKPAMFRIPLPAKEEDQLATK